MTFRLAKVAAVTSLMWGAFACSSKTTEVVVPDREVARSEHFVVYVEKDDPFVCPELVQEMERFRAALDSYFGGQLPAGQVTYYKYSSFASFQQNAPCTEGSGACSIDANVFSSSALDPHELVHALVYPIGLPSRVFMEGLAQVFGCELNEQGPFPSSGSFADLFNWQGTPEQYSAAQLLVGHLLHLDRNAFLELYKSLEPKSDAAEADKALQSLFGASGDQLLKEALQNTTSPAWCIRAWECSEPLLEPQNTNDWTYDVNCQAPIFRTLKTSEPEALVTLNAYVYGDCPDDSGTELNRSVGQYVLTSTAGEHFFGFRVPLPGIMVSEYPHEQVLQKPSDCSPNSSLGGGLDLDFNLSLDLIPSATFVAPWYLSLASGAPQFTYTLSATCTEGLSLQLCESCDTLDDCQTLCPGSSQLNRPSSTSDIPILRFDTSGLKGVSTFDALILMGSSQQ